VFLLTLSKGGGNTEKGAGKEENAEHGIGVSISFWTPKRRNCWRTTQNMCASPWNSIERHLEEHLSQQHIRLQKDP